VALRAAFVAVPGGRQVAVLVPTTLLAQQHHQTFADRFADWPVKVELLSRFRPARNRKATLDGLAHGQGRHRHRHAQTAAARGAIQGPRDS
jgi:transcription-repair coupling factor (superfamily II helicase)